jgi:hypothetical protein
MKRAHTSLHKTIKIVVLVLVAAAIIPVAGCSSGTKTAEDQPRVNGLTQLKNDPKVPQYVKDKYLGGSSDIARGTSTQPVTG